ncbi:hypothetical protein NH340_JMT07984 [Sarcoptes scabiei]|nr:hypothetical protein NH340_JMT07984 [Sarcoptes scabiei]
MVYARVDKFTLRSAIISFQLSKTHHFSFRFRFEMRMALNRCVVLATFFDEKLS